MATVPEQLEQLTKDKTKLSEVLSSKGVVASPSETFTTLVPKISEIHGIVVSDADVQGGDILDGKIAYNNEGKVVGYDRDRNVRVDPSFANTSATWNNQDRLATFIATLPDTLDCSKLPTAAYLLHGMKAITKLPNLINTSKITSYYYCFSDISKITTIPTIDMSSAVNIAGLIDHCTALKTLPALDCSKVTTISEFSERNFFNGCGAITNVGGFINLGMAYSNTAAANKPEYCLWMGSRYNDGASLPYLTIDSLANIANGLYDLNLNGVKTQTIYLIDKCYTRLSKDSRWSEIIATIESKGWKLVSYSG